MNESLMLMGFGTNKSGSGTDLVPLGYPASRWLYATNPAYLTIDPPHVTFLTAGMLTPPIMRERVRFADNDCSFEALNASQARILSEGSPSSRDHHHPPP